jgi:benzoyl-CoA reductase/2-hydroxyglutaryl-CoA dehydratase subunit BcrC/BadD/HgdB
MRNILYACSYVPVEIVSAAGCAPVWLLPESDPQNADQYIHSLTCPYVRKLCVALLDDAAGSAEGIVLTNSCDGMRRLADVIGAYRPELPLLFLDLPQKSDPASIGLFSGQLRRLADAMAATFSETSVDDDSLWRTIGAYNEVRLDMRELFMQLRTATLIVSGSEVY